MNTEEVFANFDALDINRLRRRRSEKWTFFPEDVLPAWIAEMDFPVCDSIRAALSAMIEGSDLGYSSSRGPSLDALRELLVTRLQSRYGWRIPMDNVEIISDIVRGIYLSLQVFSQEGDGVIIQPPIYPPFLSCVRNNNRRLIANALQRATGGYIVDFDALEASVDASTRILLLCNPHNPTGRVFTRTELERFAEVAARHDLLIISDEIHADLEISDCRHIPIASMGPEIAARCVTLMSATKTFNIPGLPCALAVFGSPDLKRRFCAIPEEQRYGASLLGVEAAVAAWRDGDQWLSHVKAYLRNNSRRVTEFVRREWPNTNYHPPEATYLAWLDFRAANLPSDPYSFFLERSRVALGNGIWFGEGGDGFVRLNFATCAKIVDEILDRMNKALRSSPGVNLR